ncbi:MAG: PEGA domain-containing protein [Victivallaceae bacterium]|nr:PEGA domain-containing protein [Victivallaceae bacterium]
MDAKKRFAIVLLFAMIFSLTRPATGNESAALKTTPPKLRVCVLDFTSTDIKGQERFLSGKNQKIEIPAQNTLNKDDRKSINSVMQGFVRMIDAWDTSRTGTAERASQVQDNERTYAQMIELYNTVVKGEMRPMVIGAEYLTSYLGNKSDVFNCVDSEAIMVAMNRLQAEPDFPKDFMLKLAQNTGVTHLIYGTVSDLRSSENSFKGYGIETKTTNYQLDVLIKVVDLVRGHSVYSNVYTGNYREQRPLSSAQFDNNVFQSLMTSALKQAAEDLYEVSKPGSKNKISVTPLPFKVKIVPSGGFFFKATSAKISMDGELLGSGEQTFSVPEGKHRFEIKAPGYKVYVRELDITSDMTIEAKLLK